MGSKWAVSGEMHFQAGEQLQDLWGKLGSLSARGARGHWWPVSPIKTSDLKSKDRVEAHGGFQDCHRWMLLEIPKVAGSYRGQEFRRS